MSKQLIKKEKVGEGTYGKVYRAVVGKNSYGVKRNLIEKKLDFIASVREMDLLYRFRDHPYIISIECVKSEPFKGPMSPISSDLKDDNIHFVFPYAETDLRITDEITDAKKLTRYMVNILLGVEFIHSKNIIHRDLKPHNILLVDGEIKICDFGLAKPFSYQGPNSPRVVTSWYRAPELLLMKEDYDFGIDIWSLGCIFFEMIAKRPFVSDVDDINREIMKKIKMALPSNDVDFFGNSWEYQLFGEEDPTIENSSHFVDLLSNMICFDPSKRYTSTQCLNHIFFREHIRHINSVRKAYPPRNDEYEKVKCINCNERKWGFELACILFNRRKEFKWYDHRVIFQSIDIFDRYLLYLNPLKKRMEQTDENGYFLNKYEARLTFIVCLYIAIKYFPGMTYPVSFIDLVESKYKTQEAILKAEMIEKFLITKVLNYRIYRDTIYDIFKQKLSGKQIRDLLVIVGNIHSLDQDMKLDELAELISEEFRL